MPLRLTVVLAITCAAAVAAADQDVAAKAKAAFMKAEVQYRLGNFNEALGLYQESLSLVRRPSVLFNIGQCYRQLKQPERALFYYKLFLADWDREHPGEPPPQLTEVQGHIAALTEQVRELERRKAALAEQQQREAQEQLRLQQEQQRLERLRLEKTRPAVTPMGRLRLEGLTAAGAAVVIDGVHKATTPVLGALELPAGRHTVRVAAAGFYSWTGEVQVTADHETQMAVELRPLPRRNRLWLGSAITALVLVAGAETGAVLYTVAANGHYRDTPTFNHDARLARDWHIVAGCVGALAVTSFVLYLVSGRKPRHAGPTVAILPGATGLHAAALVQFE